MAQNVIDVFLTHAAPDAGMAALVTREFEAAGCGVFAFQSLEPGDDRRDRMVEALVESTAVVVLLTKSSLSSPMVGVEVGAALAWTKPVFVVYDGIAAAEIPAYLREFTVAPLSAVGDVVRQVVAARTPLSERERSHLAKTYEELRVPVDRLLVEPSEWRAFTEAYRRRVKRAVPAKRLVQELVRMRKLGKLPRVAELPVAS